MDLVINHTSSSHAWFLQSRSSLTNPKRDWYIWRPAKKSLTGDRLPPNNWKSIFGGSAWQWDEKTEEYYLRIFAESQPDINWDNEEVRKEIREGVTDWWLKKGIDGFRVGGLQVFPGLVTSANRSSGEIAIHTIARRNQLYQQTTWFTRCTHN